jgi:hypothetical protein
LAKLVRYEHVTTTLNNPLDPALLAAKQFHVENHPRSFVFNRQGKLVALAVDQRSRRQFFQMLAAAGLHP